MISVDYLNRSFNVKRFAGFFCFGLIILVCYYMIMWLYDSVIYYIVMLIRNCKQLSLY